MSEPLSMNACGVSSATVIVQIDPLPNAGNDNSVSVGEGSLVNLNLLLSVDSTSGTFSTPTLVAATGTEIYAFVSGVGGNCGTDSALITVIGIPSGNAGEDNEVHVCEGASPIDLMTYLTGADQGGVWLNGDNQEVTMPVDIHASGTFMYQVNGDEAMVSVFMAPLPDAGTSTTATLCTGDAAVDMLSLLGGQPGGTWSGPDPVIGNLLDPGSMHSGAYVYTLTDTCGSDADTVTVNITPVADASWSAPVVLCANSGPVEMNALVTGAPGGSWTGDQLSGTFFDPAGLVGSFSFSYTAGAGVCASTVTHAITVNPGPIANAGADDQVCALNYTLQAVIDVVPGTWSAQAGLSDTIFSETSDPHALITVPATGAYPLVWTVGDGQCTA